MLAVLLFGTLPAWRATRTDLVTPLKEGSRWAQLHGYIQHLYQTTMGHTIAGGTSEVLRTTVAVRGLGLPREPRGRS